MSPKRDSNCRGRESSVIRPLLYLQATMSGLRWIAFTSEPFSFNQIRNNTKIWRALSAVVSSRLLSLFFLFLSTWNKEKSNFIYSLSICDVIFSHKMSTKDVMAMLFGMSLLLSRPFFTFHTVHCHTILKRPFKWWALVFFNHSFIFCIDFVIPS